MSHHFHHFAHDVHNTWNVMSRSTELYTVAPVGTPAQDALWQAYLAAFPPGTNEVYKTNTEHDCSCCRHFIKNIGGVVAIVGNSLHTVWDNQSLLPEPYATVAEAMRKKVLSMPLDGLFRVGEVSYGAAQTRQLLEDQTTHTWHHFHAKVPAKFVTKSDTERGKFNTGLATLKRALVELKPNALQTVLELIDSKALYRGEEHRNSVQTFFDHQLAWAAVAADAKAEERYLYRHATSTTAHFRNTVIGTLVQDLSDGMELEQAVRSFETKVAPTNYKRPTALITPTMINAAMKTLAELGLEPALDRRLAVLADVSVNDVLWVDTQVAPLMREGVHNLLMAEAKASVPTLKDAVNIGIEAFMRDVLPKAHGVELFLSNAHLSNFMALTAPVHHDAPRLFKWANPFGWSYDGNVTDSVRERVKAAGGNVDAKLRFSLAWFNTDDLDLHVYTPSNAHIYYGNKRAGGVSGVLDVDANGMDGIRPDPVENVAATRPMDGVYRVHVHQFSKRNTDKPGFVFEVASGAGVQQYSYDKPMAHGATVEIGAFSVQNGAVVGMQLNSALKGGGIPTQKWGLTTERMVTVGTIMLSPNHWEGNAVGNKHWFFVLDNCVVDKPMRGIYNEFLRPELDVHRKVFEVLGNKTLCAPNDGAMAGLGFSSTRGDTVLLQVTGERMKRLYKVAF